MSICVYADSNRYKPIAIVVPSEPTLLKFVALKNIAPQGTSLENLCEDEKVIKAVYEELVTVGKRAGLKGMELIQGLVLVPDEWAPENVGPRWTNANCRTC
jgi:long-chain acyl-CoA synthetase